MKNSNLHVQFKKKLCGIKDFQLSSLENGTNSDQNNFVSLNLTVIRDKSNIAILIETKTCFENLLLLLYLRILKLKSQSQSKWH